MDDELAMLIAEKSTNKQIICENPKIEKEIFRKSNNKAIDSKKIDRGRQ